MDAKHSPGPWALEEREGGGFKLSDADGEFIDYITDSRYVDGRDDPEAIANAHLIAAALDLLEACDKAFEFLGGVEDASTIRDILLTAILKAKAS